jgi:hypothetical protein
LLARGRIAAPDRMGLYEATYWGRRYHRAEDLSAALPFYRR